MGDLYMRQRVFSWGDKFEIYDNAGNVKYYVEGEVFTFGKKLHLYDTAGKRHKRASSIRQEREDKER